MAKKKTVRPGKGESLFKFLDDYTVVDLETTGLSPTTEAIIEIGAIKIRDGKEVARFSKLINPNRPIPPFITELTGITDAMVADAETEIPVLTEFLEFLGDDVILGQNVNFDVNFLYDACARLELGQLTNDFVDTMRLSQRLLPKLPHHRLQDLTEYFGFEYKNAHRAVTDCEFTHLAYRGMFTLN